MGLSVDELPLKRSWFSFTTTRFSHSLLSAIRVIIPVLSGEAQMFTFSLSVIINIETNTNIKDFMAINKPVGRHTVLNSRTLLKLTNALRNNYNVTDSCKWAGISRNTFYRHMDNDMAFEARINYAIECRDKVSFNFDTIY